MQTPAHFSCGHPYDHRGAFRGAAYDADKKLVCEDCASASMRDLMRSRPTRFCAYVAVDGRSITDFRGKLLMSVARSRNFAIQRSHIHGTSMTEFRCVDIFGGWWRGRSSAGLNVNLRPIRTPAHSNQFATPKA